MIHWNVSPELVQLGPLTIRWYGALFAAGFLIGLKIIERLCRLEGKPDEKMSDLLIFAILGTTVGARLGHCLFYDPAHYLTHPLEIFKIWEGGLASHGGTVGVMTAIWLFAKRNPEFTFAWTLDRMAVSSSFAAGMIRLGNLFNSEIIGKPTSAPWAFVFERIDQYPRHPTQLYESLTYFFTCWFLHWYHKKKRYTPPPGAMFGWMCIFIFGSRFLWEFIKENQEPFEAGLPINMGQILSIPFVIMGITLVYCAPRWGNKKVNE